jgi:hypothetical protein
MVGVLMLKYLYNLGDERIPEYWVRDVYFQYFYHHEPAGRFNLSDVENNLSKVLSRRRKS